MKLLKITEKLRNIWASMPLNSPSLPDNLDINSSMPKLSSEGDSEKIFGEISRLILKSVL